MENSRFSTLLIVTELSSPHTIACAFSPGLSVHPGAGRRRTWDRGVAWGGSGAAWAGGGRLGAAWGGAPCRVVVAERTGLDEEPSLLPG
jgi:hypothetical protein